MGPPKSFPSRTHPPAPKEEGPPIAAPPPDTKKEEPGPNREEPLKRSRSNTDHLTTHSEYFLPEAPPPETPTEPPHIDGKVGIRSNVVDLKEELVK